MNSRILLIITSIVILTATGTDAQTIKTGRSIGLAGSNAIGMFGTEAVSWNPANLGLRYNPSLSIRLPSIGFGMENNAFSPQYISDTFVDGKFLTRSDKAEIISKLTDDKWKLTAAGGAPLFGLSSSTFAFNFDLHSAIKANIPRDLIRLALYGWIKDEIYEFKNVEEKGMAYMTASFSAAKPINQSFIPYVDELAIGGTFKYILGLTYGGVAKADARFQVTDHIINADGIMQFEESQTGDGVGIDLGIAGYIPDYNTYVGMTYGNVSGNIHWTRVRVNETQFSLHNAVNIDSVNSEEYINDLFNQTDTTFVGTSFKEPLPSYLMFSASKPIVIFKKESNIYFSYYQGLNDALGHSTTPRLSLGSEWNVIPIIPVRLGVAVGGIEETVYSGGIGLNLRYFQLNVGASWQRGILAGAEGYSLAITTYFTGSKPLLKKIRRSSGQSDNDESSLITVAKVTMQDLNLSSLKSGEKDHSKEMDPFRNGSVYYKVIDEKISNAKRYSDFFKQTAVIAARVSLAQLIVNAIDENSEKTISRYKLDPSQKPVTTPASPLHKFVTETLRGSVKEALLLKVEANKLRESLSADLKGLEIEDELSKEFENTAESLEESLRQLPKLIRILISSN